MPNVLAQDISRRTSLRPLNINPEENHNSLISLKVCLSISWSSLLLSNIFSDVLNFKFQFIKRGFLVDLFGYHLSLKWITLKTNQIIKLNTFSMLFKSNYKSFKIFKQRLIFVLFLCKTLLKTIKHFLILSFD